jgi:pyrophosphatase PpaX
VRHRVVLFDLDGTLIDSGPIILASMKHAARTVLGREFEDEVLAAAVGGPGLFAQMEALDAGRVDELVDVYRAHNEPLHETLETFADMLAVLATLKADGRLLGIVTAKRRATVRLAFERVPALEGFFDAVVTAEDTERHKPDPEPLLHALALLGGAPHEAAYVGDSTFDVRAAKAGGLFAVAVAWGGLHAEDTVLAEEPDAYVSEPEELLDVL